ncbi:hypothetical protein HKBW3S09_02018 [Candidatus Hakubella thermalkaliphila]|uniref:Alpha-D-phosphohexomutase alpha/beta/alpha domain-containing protein n=1 Tax=Candidatus Hakubella thermalkaliphila TaxID=2754717 RepID=A0A6V8NYP7_9ACTN|nr:hypothetical protein HKBW3S09_02018 [Candidatus Hakubella thermalkaliphila]
MPADIEPIVACMADILVSGTVNRFSLAKAWEKGLVEVIEPFNDYAAQLETMIDFATIKEREISVVVDAMFGAGISYLEELLGRHDCKVTAIHNWRDLLFGGSLPEPSANHLHQLCQAVRERKAELGVALDGDADRLGW